MGGGGGGGGCDHTDLQYCMESGILTCLSECIKVVKKNQTRVDKSSPIRARFPSLLVQSPSN